MRTRRQIIATTLLAAIGLTLAGTAGAHEGEWRGGRGHGYAMDRDEGRHYGWGEHHHHRHDHYREPVFVAPAVVYPRQAYYPPQAYYPQARYSYNRPSVVIDLPQLVIPLR